LLFKNFRWNLKIQYDYSLISSFFCVCLFSVIFKLDDPFGPQCAFQHGLMEPGPLYAALPPHLSSHGHRRRQRAALGPPQAKTARPLSRGSGSLPPPLRSGGR
jgi:hypothetical protein